MNIHNRFRFSRRFAFILLAPDTGGGSGGGTAPEPATLAEARTALGIARAELATSQATVTTLTAERDQARSQFDAATEAAVTANTERDQARGELATANGTITRLNAELATANTATATANTNITRLEKLCGVKGIDPSAAVPVVTESTAKGTKDQQIEALQAEMKTASPEDKFKLAAQIRDLRDK